MFYNNKLDLRDYVDPGDIYIDNYSRRWIVETVFPSLIVMTRLTETGFFIRECFNKGTLITEGVLKNV